VIDLHAHFLLPEYVAAAERAGHLRPDGLSRWPEWSVQQHLAAMDASGIEKAVLSVPSPGVHFGEDFRAQVLARRMNEAAAALDHDRFGFFASLPLPDVEGAVAEVDYAYDVLHADGVVLLSNAGGLYPGDPSWEPLVANAERPVRDGAAAPDLASAMAPGRARRPPRSEDLRRALTAPPEAWC